MLAVGEPRDQLRRLPRFLRPPGPLGPLGPLGQASGRTKAQRGGLAGDCPWRSAARPEGRGAGGCNGPLRDLPFGGMRRPPDSLGPETDPCAPRQQCSPTEDARRAPQPGLAHGVMTSLADRAQSPQGTHASAQQHQDRDCSHLLPAGTPAATPPPSAARALPGR